MNVYFLQSNVPFSIDENNGELRVSGDVDYDNVPRSYQITLAATVSISVLY